MKNSLYGRDEQIADLKSVGHTPRKNCKMIRCAFIGSKARRVERIRERKEKQNENSMRQFLLRRIN